VVILIEMPRLQGVPVPQRLPHIVAFSDNKQLVPVKQVIQGT
ncbi:hypothetical protein LCGC14_3137170, partial [marine sediment metagenome]